MEPSWPADAPNAGKPSAEQPSSHGTGPMPHSDGPGPTLSDLLVVGMQLVQALTLQAQAIAELAASNERLADELAALAPDEPEEPESAGLDMAGKPIRVS